MEICTRVVIITQSWENLFSKTFWGCKKVITPYIKVQRKNVHVLFFNFFYELVSAFKKRN